MKQNPVFKISYPWYCVKELVFVPPRLSLCKSSDDVITHVIAQIEENRLEKVWHEFNYRIDV
jgi:hypothetical protein